MSRFNRRSSKETVGDYLRNASVCSFHAHGPDTFSVHEECDNCYEAVLSAQDMRDLAAEILAMVEAEQPKGAT